MAGPCLMKELGVLGLAFLIVDCLCNASGSVGGSIAIYWKNCILQIDAK